MSNRTVIIATVANFIFGVLAFIGLQQLFSPLSEMIIPPIASLFLILTGFISQIVLIWIVYFDAKQKNISSNWLIVPFFLGSLGSLIYYFVNKNREA
ncbi:hypothetical protein HYY72_03695 [Candidatus Woesearchaeota archaeon]|nr:hypothetical protein [Candidatus Woesearchaeota archaeon]